MYDLEKIKKLQGKVMKDIAAGALIPMIRIGDEIEDIEYYGNTCDFNMYVERNIQW